MKEPEFVTLPPINAEDYRILMAGLGELPAKASRRLMNRFEEHVRVQTEKRDADAS